MRLSFWPFVGLSLLVHLALLRPELPDILSGASAAPSAAGGSVALRFRPAAESSASAVAQEESTPPEDAPESTVPEQPTEPLETEQAQPPPEVSEELAPEDTQTAGESPENTLLADAETKESQEALWLESSTPEQPQEPEAVDVAQKPELEKAELPAVDSKDTASASPKENAVKAPPVVKPEAVAPAPQPEAQPSAKPEPAAPPSLSSDQSSSASLAALPAQSSPGPEPELILGQGNAPSYDKFLPPKYPESLRRRGVSGSVRLRVLVSAQGRAEQVEVLRSSHPQFSGPARDSARRSTYRPLLRDGRAEACWVTLTMSFDLK